MQRLKEDTKGKRSGTIWSEQSPPTLTLLDRALLMINLPCIGLCAGLRAVLWLLEINMAGLPFCSPGKYVRWEGALLPPAKNDAAVEDDEDRLPGIWRALTERHAQRFPHAGARPFTDHIAGVANILGAWEQPVDICLAGLIHSVYSTEMFPWRLFKLSEREELRALSGPRVERLVFLYCTCSQQELYKEVKHISARRMTIAGGLRVRNYYTGERALLEAREAAQLLIILAADLMEQDSYFSLHLPLACLRLAAPHLTVRPKLCRKLEETGFYDKDEHMLENVENHARELLQRAPKWDALPQPVRKARLEQLIDAAEAAPWLYELSVEAARLGGDVARGVSRSGGGAMGTSHQTYEWCLAWGTRWSRVCSPQDALAYTCDATQVQQVCHICTIHEL